MSCTLCRNVLLHFSIVVADLVKILLESLLSSCCDTGLCSDLLSPRIMHSIRQEMLHRVCVAAPDAQGQMYVPRIYCRLFKMELCMHIACKA